MRILLMEDDPDLGPAIARALRAEQCAVDLFANGVDGEHAGATETYDAAVLDLDCPPRMASACYANGARPIAECQY